jgi:hypothetical protein
MGMSGGKLDLADCFPLSGVAWNFLFGNFGRRRLAGKEGGTCTCKLGPVKNYHGRIRNPQQD